MKKILILMAAVLLVSSVSGCGCFRRMRDFLCRGSYCGSQTAAVAAPAYAAPPMMAAPMAYDPGCSYDPGCGYGGVQTYGYNGYPMEMGMSGCDSCQSGYSLPTYAGESYMDGAVDPGPSPAQ
ncbi:hypothetical protein Mal64_24680 [Pseudobythopirellula maris]|uniref:Lipoprotein n=1 Tax=Pseudobythopirellula maris TaxID=2527991 RepID=A0A5C5ZPY3_9BACT|nr:hypothetical protein [Pseudobythopirellula maris]TWT88977.1 hypothetical protein Mal64_24680 [Pseudobythopirellula maris]